MSFYPFVPHEISVLIELILGHLRYLLTDVPPQPNSPPDNVFNLGRGSRGRARERGVRIPFATPEAKGRALPRSRRTEEKRTRPPFPTQLNK